MKKIKVRRLGPIFSNLLVFLIFSPVFLYIIDSLLKRNTFLDISLAIPFLRNNWMIFSLCIISFFLTFKMKPFSLFFSGLSFFYCSFEMGMMLYKQFDKLVLFLIFLYMIIGFFVLLYAVTERNESFYKSKIDKNELSHHLNFKIEGILKFHQKNTEVELLGYLTNWNENGCFIRLDEPYKISPKFVDLVVDFEGVEFKASGLVVSKLKDSSGYGLNFSSVQNDTSLKSFGWSEFNMVLFDRGLISGMMS